MGVVLWLLASGGAHAGGHSWAAHSIWRNINAGPAVEWIWTACDACPTSRLRCGALHELLPGVRPLAPAPSSAAPPPNPQFTSRHASTPQPRPLECVGLFCRSTAGLALGAAKTRRLRMWRTACVGCPRTHCRRRTCVLRHCMSTWRCAAGRIGCSGRRESGKLGVKRCAVVNVLSGHLLDSAAGRMLVHMATQVFRAHRHTVPLCMPSHFQTQASDAGSFHTWASHGQRSSMADAVGDTAVPRGWLGSAWLTSDNFQSRFCTTAKDPLQSTSLMLYPTCTIASTRLASWCDSVVGWRCRRCRRGAGLLMR